MAADTGYLWQAISVQGLGIKIAAIPYTSLPVTMTLDDSRWKTPTGWNSIEHELDMSYDEKYTKDWGHPTVRMVYYKDADSRIHTGRIERQSSGEALTSDIVVYSSTANDSGYHIICNPNDVSGGIKQAFAAFETGTQAKTGRSSNLNANNELWNYDTSYSSGSSFRNGLTYRWNGDKFLVWATNAAGSWDSGSELHTNHGDLDPVFGNTNAWEPSVYTNPVNKRELVASWHTWYDFNNDQTVDDEGVFVCRELLP